MARAPFQVLVLPWRRRVAASASPGCAGARSTPEGSAESIEVAVFHRADYDIWQFVSGGGEDDETPLAAARREGLEEAGIPTSTSYLALDSMATLPACWYRAWPTWPANVLVIPEYAFAAEVANVQRSDEHRDLRWCSLNDAMALLKFDSNRHALWELGEHITPGPREKRVAYSHDPWT